MYNLHEGKRHRYSVTTRPRRQVVLSDCPPDCPWLGYKRRILSVKSATEPTKDNAYCPIDPVSMSHVDNTVSAFYKIGLRLSRTDIMNLARNLPSYGDCNRFAPQEGCLFELRTFKVK